MATKKPALTHFLCLPLINAASRSVLEGSIRKFKEEAISLQQALIEDDTAGGAKRVNNAKVVLDLLRNPRAVRPIGTLHLTIGVMSLQDGKNQEPGARLQEAITLLDKFERLSSPLLIDLAGLNSMSTPTKTSSLYAPPSDASGRLALLCAQIRTAFVDAGLVADKTRDLKLHATMLNSVYAKPGARRDSDGSAAEHDNLETSARGPQSAFKPPKKVSSKSPVKFDAALLLDHFEDFPWVHDLVLDRLAICEMGAKKVLDSEGLVVDEEYIEIFSVSLYHKGSKLDA